MTLTVGSLFSGIGGLELGLERAGMRTVWQVEKDEYCRRVLAKHWPDVQRFNDVREVGAHNLPPVDLICGGFPCQDISSAGKKAGIAEGTRSGLWFEYARIVRELRPQYVIVENVAAILFRGLDVVLGDLATLGYDAEWHCVPASYVGAPHRRDRVFIVAYTPGEPGRDKRGDVHQADGRQDRALRGESRDAGQESPHLANDPSIGRGARGARRLDTRGARESEQPLQDVADAVSGRLKQQRRPLAGEILSRRQVPGAECGGGGCGGSQWLVEPNVGRVANGVPSRVDRLRGLGNAVVPQVSQFIGELIVDAHLRSLREQESPAA